VLRLSRTAARSRPAILVRTARIGIFLLAAASSLPAVSAQAEDPVEQLIREIVRDTRQTRHYTGISELSERVINSMRQTPRDRFVPRDSELYAWENRPLSIGYGQTISQPFIVALMTELLEPRRTGRVLEIGTGSGYQAAVLSSLVKDVYTIEIVPELAASAKTRLEELGYDNVHVKAGDGWHGWPDAAPFDGIIVTAVAEEIPPKLIEQLAPGGRIVIPLGPAWGAQMLVVATKTDTGMEQRDVLPVQFVPFTRSDEEDGEP
jgi:protein-L-isoaspartate(D-aspartate) O-methyltransferase